MARGSFPLYALNGGEVSKNALARVDLAKMRLAAQCQVNWLPFVVGPAMLRPGLQFIGEVVGDQQSISRPFVFSKLDTARMEFTPNVMRVWINDVLVTRPTVTTTIGDPNFTGVGGFWNTSDTTAGCTVTLGASGLQMAAIVSGLVRARQAITVPGGSIGVEHGIRIVVADGPVTVRAGSTLHGYDLIGTTNLDPGTHCLACTPTGGTIFIEIQSQDLWLKTVVSCSIDAAGTLTVPTPWAAGNLADIRIDQSGDIVFVACRNVPQYKIERRSAHGWSVAQFQSVNGPFQTTPGSTANFILSQNFGTATLTSDQPYFQPGHAGALFQLFIPSQGGALANLGGSNAFTPPIRVSGVGGDRAIGISSGGTWSGTLQIQRSYTGPDDGFIDVAQDNNTTPNAGANTSNFNYGNGSGNPWSDAANSAHSGVLGLDNVIVWYRVGFKPGQYTSGVAVIDISYAGGAVFAICRVTNAPGNPLAVNVDILQNGAGPVETQDWLESYWSGATTGAGYPTSVCFHEGRLWWFGENFWWGSQSDDFVGYASQDDQGNTLGDSGVIIGTFGSGPADTVSWGLSLTRLLMGREQSIASARSSNFDQPLTPTDIVVRDCSDQGAQRLPALKLGKRGIYVQQSNRKVYELFFNPSEFDYDERDLTRLNLDIGVPGFVAIDKSVQPDHVIWLPRADGQVAALLYDVKDEIEAWWRLMTLGVVEDVCVLPGSALEDQVYLTVKRTVNGVTRRFTEKMAPRANATGGALNQCLDCHVVYQGAPTNSITLTQLPNTTVQVWADGAFIGSGTTNGSGVLTPLPDGQNHATIIAGIGGVVITGSVNSPLANNTQPNQIFSGPQNALFLGSQYAGFPAEVFADIGGTGRPPEHVGSLTVTINGFVVLPNSQVATTIVACLGYVAPFMSAKLAYAVQGGTALAQKKKLDHVGLVLYDTAASGLLVGQDFAMLDPMPALEADQAPAGGTVWSEYDGPFQELPGAWDTDARLCLLAQAPNPATLGAVVVAMQTSERG